MNSFFAYLNRMKYIERWSLMRSVTKENIMEHSQQVAVIAHALAVIGNTYFAKNYDPNKVAVVALFHESGEVITGDLPTPIKYFNSEIKSAYKDLEKIATEKLVTKMPKEMQGVYSSLLIHNEKSEDYKIMKCADKLSAYIKCIEELKAGNKEFEKAKKAIETDLGKMGEEVTFFMEHFIKPFTLTLDELDD